MAILTVGTGGTYSTLTAAQTAAVSGVDSLMLVSNLTENFVLSKNIVSIYSDNGARVWDSTGNGATLTVNNGLTALCEIRDLIIDKTASNNNANTVIWSGVGSGSKIKFSRVTLKHSRSSGSLFRTFHMNAILTTADQLVFDRCFFDSNSFSDYGVLIANGTSTLDAILIKNCIFKGTSSGLGIGNFDNKSTKLIKCYNNTFIGWADAYVMHCKTECWNNLFLNNNSDLFISGSALKTDFLNCGFSEQVNDGGWDSTIKFGLVTATEVVNAAAGDYHLNKAAISVGVGKVISGVTEDYYSMPVLPHHSPDIGAAFLVRKRVF